MAKSASKKVVKEQPVKAKKVQPKVSSTSPKSDNPFSGKSIFALARKYAYAKVDRQKAMSDAFGSKKSLA